MLELAWPKVCRLIESMYSKLQPPSDIIFANVTEHGYVDRQLLKQGRLLLRADRQVRQRTSQPGCVFTDFFGMLCNVRHLPVSLRDHVKTKRFRPGPVDAMDYSRYRTSLHVFFRREKLFDDNGMKCAALIPVNSKFSPLQHYQ